MTTPAIVTTGKVAVASPLTVIFDGDDATATRVTRGLSSYTPVANDRVLLMRVGPQWVLVDEVVSR